MALAAVSMSAGRYLHWGVVQISLANLIVILAMILLFLAALVVPFPGDQAERRGRSDER